MRKFSVVGACVGLGLFVGGATPLAACGGPRAVRGQDTPGLDDAAMGTGLDRVDLDKMLRENLDVLGNSAVFQRWAGEGRPPVSVLPIRNETSEHIESALGALISEVESQLINRAPVRVISLENQQDLMKEIQRQHHSEGAFDQAELASWGKQLGARYLVTGKVYSSEERTAKARRVQYYLFLRILAVETGEVVFQNQAAVTKAIL